MEPIIVVAVIGAVATVIAAGLKVLGDVVSGVTKAAQSANEAAVAQANKALELASQEVDWSRGIIARHTADMAKVIEAENRQAQLLERLIMTLEEARTQAAKEHDRISASQERIAEIIDRALERRRPSQD